MRVIIRTFVILSIIFIFSGLDNSKTVSVFEISSFEIIDTNYFEVCCGEFSNLRKLDSSNQYILILKDEIFLSLSVADSKNDSNIFFKILFKKAVQKLMNEKGLSIEKEFLEETANEFVRKTDSSLFYFSNDFKPFTHKIKINNFSIEFFYDFRGSGILKKIFELQIKKLE